MRCWGIYSISTTSLFTLSLILEIYFLRRTFNRSIYLGLFCALFGAFIIFLGAPKDNDMLGNMFALLCSLILAISFLISERVRKSESTIVYTRTLYSSAAATLFLLLVFLDKDIVPVNNHVF